MEKNITDQETLKHTSLYDSHRALNARMVAYEGWSLPVMYAGILEEARAVRSQTGIFDISHMGRVRVFGDDATAFLQKLTSNDVAALKAGEAQYSLLMHPQGGIIDDIIVYREDTASYFVVINAGNAAKDLAWMQTQAAGDITIHDQSAMTAMIAVQGPSAPQIVAHLAANMALLERKRFQYATGMLAGVPATFCRTGYTGEDGFEIIVPAKQAQEAWSALLDANAVPCGLGARDALRIEAGYPLYGHEIDETTSPVEAGLMWVVKLDKGDFFGRDAILKVKREGPARRLMGLTSSERIVPRQGYTIYAAGQGNEGNNNGREDQAIGTVTSGVFSPTRSHSIALGYIAADAAHQGGSVTIGIRDKRARATIVQKKALLQAPASENLQ